MMGGTVVTHEAIDNTQALLIVLADPKRSSDMLAQLKQAKTDADAAVEKSSSVSAKAAIDMRDAETVRAEAARLMQEARAKAAALDQKEQGLNRREAELSAGESRLKQTQSTFERESSATNTKLLERSKALDDRDKALKAKETAAEEMRSTYAAKLQRINAATA